MKYIDNLRLSSKVFFVLVFNVIVILNDDMITNLGMLRGQYV